MRDPTPILLCDSRQREHAAPADHPERPDRIEAIVHGLAPLADQLCVATPREATDEEILAAHDRGLLERLRALEGHNAWLDPDTYSAPHSLEIARRAAGGLIDAALAVATGSAASAFAALRPPGHHAEASRPMGFCLLNHVAIAARALQRELGVERIAIVDWDVHHGNGTQHIFEAERDVLFVSLHQWPLYPGTGALEEHGRGEGLGSTVNMPLPPGCGDAEYAWAFDEIVVPRLLAFRPELILVSAGYDAHRDDPLASMKLTSGGFGALASRLRLAADETCAGRIVMSLEGGYELAALGESVLETVRALLAPEPRVGSFPMPGTPHLATLQRMRRALLDR
jgi:acetoin utilization deacetylase AcuC-like enzyme